MNNTDREEFDRLLGELCAGYDRPPGDRPAAYWKGLAKMGLGQFARVVEFVLSEQGPERFPTVRAIWDIHRQRKSLTGPAMPEAEDPVMRLSEGRHIACQWFIQRCREAGGFKAGGLWIDRLRLRCYELADQFDLMRAERDPEATTRRFVGYLDAWLAEWQQLRAAP